jgi:hypothetical protein
MTLTRSDERAAPAQSLSGQHALPAISRLSIRAVHVANLSAGNANITSGHIGIRANMLGQLAHKRLAEAADLAIRLALGVEVGTALATAHVYCTTTR